MTQPNRISLLSLACSAVLSLAACGPSDESDPKTAAPAAPVGSPPPAATDSAAALREAGQELSKAAGNFLDKSRDAAAEALDKAKERTAEAAEKAKEMTAVAIERGKEATAAAAGRTEELIRQARESIAQNRPEMAQSVLDSLDRAKDSLSLEVREEVARLRAMLEGTQAAPIPAVAPAQTPAPVPAAASVPSGG